MTIAILSEKGYTIPLKNISHDKLKEIKKELTVLPNNVEYTQKEKEKVQYKLYSEDKTHITIPRYYGVAKFGEPSTITFRPKTRDIKFTGSLRDYQEPIVTKCLTDIRAKGGGLLSVPCGAGKTTMALKIASELGVKTLVVVHKTFLLDQWVTRAEQFTDARIGIIRQKKVKTKGKDIVIALIQSLSRRDYDEDIFKEFGLVIYDECHHVASRMFSQALAKTGVKYTLGLSATPYRSDGLVRVMHWYIGNMMYQIKLKTNNQVMTKAISFTSNNAKFKESKRYIQGKMRPDCVKMISGLIDIPERNDVIVNIIDQLRKNPLRKILILSDRKNHLKLLKDRVDKFLDRDAEDDIIDRSEYTTCYYTGDLKQDEREYAEKNCDILFATYQMAQEGLDIDRLNTVILATPKKDVIQAVGRILRKILTIGDIRPLVIDIKDNLGVFMNHGKVREKFYVQSKYNIEYAYINDGTFMSPYQWSQYNGISGTFSKVCPASYEDVLKVAPIEVMDDDKRSVKKKCNFDFNDDDDSKDTDNDDNNSNKSIIINKKKSLNKRLF
jgi:superfamily II DNA or RNA helicase